ncbi:unnamed protein product, partial [Brassica oleracea var. botrytis]
VISVAIEGELEDELVVVGDGIDGACLVEKPQEEDDTNNSENIEAAADDNGTDETVPPHYCLAQCSTNFYEQPHSDIYEVVYDSYGPTTRCIIM